MTKPPKKPDTYSAAVTARVISRKLRKAGFRKCDTRDRYAWTTGFHVSRVGYGHDVSIWWHIKGEQHYKREHYQMRRDNLDGIRKFLEADGYVFDGRGFYIVCEHE